MSYLSDDHRLRRCRPGAASSAEQRRLEVHRSVRRDAAVVEEHRRRVGLEDGVAPRLRYMESPYRASYLRLVKTSLPKARNVKRNVDACFGESLAEFAKRSRLVL